MGQVPLLHTWNEAEPYLEMLKNTVSKDIRPLLSVPDNAPFAICREVFSYVDHLGHLYSGRPQQQVGERSKDFLRHVMSVIDQNYGKRANEIYQMFRCGTVHEFEPKTLENRSGQTLTWLCYAGPRQHTIMIHSKAVSVTHLEPVPGLTATQYSLPVSTECLVKDLETSIDKFGQAGPDNERVTLWNRAARELSTAVPYDFVV